MGGSRDSQCDGNREKLRKTKMGQRGGNHSGKGREALVEVWEILVKRDVGDSEPPSLLYESIT